MQFRALRHEDYEAASLLLWKSFYKAEKDVATLKGMERFRDATSQVSLAVHEFSEELRFYGAFLSEQLVAVGAIKSPNRIVMLYVAVEFWGKGFGRELLSFLEKELCADTVLLNASDFAVPFYLKMGYQIQGEREENEGLFTTPMKKRIFSKKPLTSEK